MYKKLLASHTVAYVSEKMMQPCIIIFCLQSENATLKNKVNSSVLSEYRNYSSEYLFIITHKDVDLIGLHYPAYSNQNPFNHRTFIGFELSDKCWQ